MDDFIMVTQSSGKKTYIRKSVISMIEPAMGGRGCIIYIGTGGDNASIKENVDDVINLLKGGE